MYVGSYILYNRNCPRKKKFVNFANLEAFANIFLHFYLSQNFYIKDCLNCASFLASYCKEGNSQNFSSADDSHYTVHIMSLYPYSSEPLSCKLYYGWTEISWSFKFLAIVSIM